MSFVLLKKNYSLQYGLIDRENYRNVFLLYTYLALLSSKSEHNIWYKSDQAVMNFVYFYKKIHFNKISYEGKHCENLNLVTYIADVSLMLWIITLPIKPYAIKS